MTGSSESVEHAFLAPDGVAEEFAAAVEASTGEGCGADWRDPMSGADLYAALDRLLLTPRPDRGLDVLVRSGAMQAVLPEIQAMVGFGEGVRHKDVWSHTKKVVLRTEPRSAVRWAALFHDIGKVSTRKFAPDGQVTFIGHPEVGARMWDRIAARLTLPGEVKDRVRFLIASHLRAASFDASWTDSAVRRFTKDAGDALEDLLELSRADITSKYTEKVRRGTEQVNLLAEKIEQVRQQDARPKPLPKGLGSVLMERFQIAPGPALGTLIRHLAGEVEAGRLEAQGEYDCYIAYLEQNAAVIREAIGENPPA